MSNSLNIYQTRIAKVGSHFRAPGTERKSISRRSVGSKNAQSGKKGGRKKLKKIKMGLPERDERESSFKEICKKRHERNQGNVQSASGKLTNGSNWYVFNPEES